LRLCDVAPSLRKLPCARSTSAGHIGAGDSAGVGGVITRQAFACAASRWTNSFADAGLRFTCASAGAAADARGAAATAAPRASRAKQARSGAHSSIQLSSLSCSWWHQCGCFGHFLWASIYSMKWESWLWRLVTAQNISMLEVLCMWLLEAQNGVLGVGGGSLLVQEEEENVRRRKGEKGRKA